MLSLRNLENEATSSAENMLTHGPSVKRKRSENNCHQCHKNDKGIVVACTKCKKKYCIPCVTKWYSTLGMTDVVEACPGCRNICNCAACLKPGMANKNLPIPDFKLSTAERIQHSKDIVRVLLPFLKQFVAAENIERVEEARIQGLPVKFLHLLKSNVSHDGHVLCNKCKGSILDVYRSCRNCLFKLCVTCCLEIRDVYPRANHRHSMHGKDSSRVTKGIVTDNGTIVCPPESFGGCGRQSMELMSRYPPNWISELLVKAEAVADVGKMTDPLEDFGVAYSGSNQGSEVENETLLAHQKVRNDNCLHCCTAMLVKKDDLKHFQWHIRRGEPVVVSDVLSGGTGLSWEPLLMWRACRKPRNPDQCIKEFRVLNCLSWNEETISINEFFKGYVEGLFDVEGRLKILNLKDWPPIGSFQEQLPRHFLEYVRCLPFMPYTHPYAGHLNLSTRIPKVPQMLDLGPKMSICYGVGQELGSSSLTMIHYAPSDRVDILMHTAEICPGPEQLSRIEKLTKINVNGGQKCIDPSISGSRDEECKEPTGGAIWDIFRRQDISKLEEYLRKHSGELKPISLLQQTVHPVHEKAFYLTVEHKRKLKEEYGIEPWTFVQKLGDAVFVPAGCPHQIKHLKSCTSVAFNFVAPESIGECIRLSTEYRCLPQNHGCKEDKLQVKQMTLHAVEKAVQYLEAIAYDTSRSQATPPPPPLHADAHQTQPSLHDLQFMKKDMEAKILTLEKRGHLVEPQMRAHLERSVKNLLNRINEEMKKNTGRTSSS